MRAISCISGEQGRRTLAAAFVLGSRLAGATHSEAPRPGVLATAIDIVVIRMAAARPESDTLPRGNQCVRTESVVIIAHSPSMKDF